MKEIKFRGLSKEEGQWVYGNLLNVDDYNYIYDKAYRDLENLDYGYCLEAVTDVGQYIGVQDINGKDVYEGDIVRLDDKLLRVGYDYIATAFRLYEGNGIYGFAGICHISEVVGNIYENPHLLKKESEV